MRKTCLFCSLVLMAFVLDACCKGGTGGKATIVCNVVTAGRPVKGVIVYVKYNSGTAPGPTTNGYDDHKQAPNNSNTVSFTGLNCGPYYFYATGFDSIQGLAVQGGGPYSLKHADRDKTENTTMSISF